MNDISHIQRELSAVIGSRVSDEDLGIALGIMPKNAAVAVRKWKSDGPTGPVARAMADLGQGLPNPAGHYAVPEYIIGPAADKEAEDTLFVTRLRFPRFVGWIAHRSIAVRDWVSIPDHDAHLTVLQWIDEWDFTPEERTDILLEAVDAIGEHLTRQERC